MQSTEIYNLLFGGGNYARPYLIKFSHPTAGTIRLVNNNAAVSYAGETYAPSTFKYNPPNKKGEGGSLDITAEDNDLLSFVFNADYKYSMRVVGCIVSPGVVEQINVYNHFYGSISGDEKGNLNFSLGKDDRLDMQFTVQLYDTESNPGNA